MIEIVKHGDSTLSCECSECGKDVRETWLMNGKNMRKDERNVGAYDSFNGEVGVWQRYRD